jgi:hypothetical protein
MLSSILFTAFAVALSLIVKNAAPASAHPSRRHDSIENSYVVRLKDGVNTTSHINSLPFPFSVEDANSPVTHWWPDDFFKGYSGIFVGAALEAILASPDVEYVEKNSVVGCVALSFTPHILNHTHSSASLIHKPTHHGTFKRSAAESLSAARTRTQ